MMRPRPLDDQQLPNLTDVQRIALQPRATRLNGDFAPLIQRLAALGNLTEVTRNPSALLEKDNVSGALYVNNEIELAPAEAMHLRIFYPQWEHGYALEEHDACNGGKQHSLQFFDRYGNMMHKIVLGENGDIASFRQLVRDHAAAEQLAPHLIHPRESDTEGNDDTLSQIDVDALRAEWAHTHNHDDFVQRQEAFDQQRLRKLRLAGKAFAYQVANDSARVILQRMTEFGTSIMAQVGNAGIVQAYYGKIKNIRVKDSRLKIMNAGFRMQLREDHIDSIWVAKKPTTDGIITSLELFNRQGTHIASFLSKKSNGQPEPREWREAIMRLMPIFGV
ncbi:hemin-degrading factor [Herbaspirillum lusitanum]|uniref:ChuX/HutX family heme-like substrate-binding protein n=1 Tax=Herbaspirillum lusitanum TaxID=213312 RepID=UPI00223799FA|nr:ChuX/HutX family heme-like substrate-binding protein [Herbaspirillum lusitanum]MCW5300734.1 hemin-degrading factor [Herbaspirillum lusitanum]